MVAVVDAILSEELRRKKAGDLRPIPFRPDHGHQMLDDLRKKNQPRLFGDWPSERHGGSARR